MDRDRKRYIAVVCRLCDVRVTNVSRRSENKEKTGQPDAVEMCSTVYDRLMAKKRKPSSELGRRDMLKIGGGLAVGALSPSLVSGCEDGQVRVLEASFDHGVASFDPTQTGIILWTRATPDDNQPPADAFTLGWEVSDTEDFSRILQKGTHVARAADDYTVRVEIEGLEPDTYYYYRFFAREKSSRTGRTRTLPTGDVASVKFVAASCSSFAHGYFHNYRRISEIDDLQFVLHLGDYIYEYGDGEYGEIRTYDPPHEIRTLSDYRRRYAHYRKDEALADLHARHPFITIWDDHEFADNADSQGAANHMPEDGNWDERRAVAKKTYHEWLPNRASASAGTYRAFACGDLMDLVLLDTRYHRAAAGFEPGSEGRGALLGLQQADWLEKTIAESGSTWRVIGNQVMVAQLTLAGAPLNPDQWDGYADERAAFLEAMGKRGDNVVITGDIHTSWVNELSPNPFSKEVYDPDDGKEGVAVEFVVPAISSPGLEGGNGLIDGIRNFNPHVKYAELEARGFCIVEVTKNAVRGSWQHLDDVEDPNAGTVGRGAYYEVKKR